MPGEAHNGEGGSGRKGRDQPSYASLDSVLKHLREISQGTVDDAVRLEEIAKNMALRCHDWKATQEEAEKLIRQFLEDVEKERKVEAVAEKKFKVREGSKRRTSNRESRQKTAGQRSKRKRSRSEGREKHRKPGEGRSRSRRKSQSHRSSRRATEQAAAAQEVAAEGVPVVEAAPVEESHVAPGPSEEPPLQDAGLIPDHLMMGPREKGQNDKHLCRKCSATIQRKGAFSNKQLTKLICELLLKDEKDFGCIHCFCDSCTGLKTNRQLLCRKAKRIESAEAGGPTSVCSTSATGEPTQCEKNTGVILKHLSKSRKRSRSKERSGRKSKRSRRSVKGSGRSPRRSRRRSRKGRKVPPT